MPRTSTLRAAEGVSSSREKVDGVGREVLVLKAGR